MGDRRHRAVFEAFADAPDRAVALGALRDHEVIYALAGATAADDPVAVNVLATEALNRNRRSRLRRAVLASALVAGLSTAVVSATVLALADFPDPSAVAAGASVLVAAGIAAAVRARRPFYPELG